MRTTLEIINQMQADGIIGKYAIGGAVGATFYLEPSATLDVDIFVTLPKVPESSLMTVAPLYDYLKARGCMVQGEYIVIGDWPVQFLPASNALEEEGLAEARPAEVEGTKTFVMGAEYLIAIALRTGRAKDHNRILQSLEQNAANIAKLKSILGHHGLESKWERFERKFLTRTDEQEGNT